MGATERERRSEKQVSKRDARGRRREAGEKHKKPERGREAGE